jgi:hypothetical protein
MLKTASKAEPGAHSTRSGAVPPPPDGCSITAIDRSRRPATSSAWSTSPRSRPTRGEKLADITDRSKDSVLGAATLAQQYPVGDGSETAVELIIDSAKFRDVFTADLPQLESDVYALSQRPIAASAFAEETGHPAWKDLPSWAAVGTEDKAAAATL